MSITQVREAQSDEARRRLDELGLSSEMLVTALSRARAEAVQCTDLDPRSARGYTLWAKVVRFLREELVQRGWEKLVVQNSELVVNYDLGIKILCCSGDANTGALAADPQPKTEKGPTFYEAIASNGDQLSFDFGPEFEIASSLLGLVVSLETWVLLYRLGRDGSSMRAELSKPQLAEGTSVTWEERILIDIPSSGDAPVAPVDVDDDEAYSLNVSRLA